MLEQKIYTVRELTNYIRTVFEADTKLANVWIKGEISNFKLHSSGHLYFTLKDSDAAIRCVMFRSRAGKMKFRPEDGMEVIAKGYISIYERMGQYQLYVEEMDPSGLGGLYMAYEQLKAKLQEEGLFDVQKKKPLPPVPSTVAVITSPTGAAIRDVLNVLNRRFPGIYILFVPAVVQGAEAPRSIVKALNTVNKHGAAEVILLVRGGGSIEELWGFNSEEVARAVAASEIPVITGVGHETDFTIVDFVADRRAPTPSAAAEIAVPVKKDLLLSVERCNRMIKALTARHICERRAKLDKVTSSRVIQKPDILLNEYRLSLDYSEQRLSSAVNMVLTSSKSRFEAAAGKLDALSPLRILARGYAICRKNNEIIGDAKLVEVGDDVEVVLRKGSLICQVNKRRGDLAWKKD
ncbi:MAG: exodeoxyribonuclease VII large subunit [Bacillota bacterium]